MKTQIKMKNIPKILLATVLAAGLWACTADPVETVRGSIGDKESLGATYGILRSAVSADNTVAVLLTVGDGAATQSLYFEQTRPAAADASVTLRVDEELVATFNAANETACELLPAANYDFPDGTTLSVAAGKQQSAPLRISLKADGLTAGTYLLPVTVAAAGESDASQTIYYSIIIREPSYNNEGEELNTDQVFLVCYINTNDYDPRLIDDFYIEKIDQTTYQTVWYRTVGNIVNLRTVTIQYEETTGRALLNLGKDMTYVLEHSSKYIWPLQEKGRKVCLSLEGGGTGLGFCNLSDEQIADFVAQVKAVVETYNLDGINLWDRNSGYGTVEGMPEMNTTSYPKLIKAMREALGTEKLLTVTDHEKPTETFWDTEATGGITVGDYLDYAWSGYNDEEEIVQIVDPWHPGADNVSLHARKPIAGLDASQYGCINIPWYKGSSDKKDMTHIFNWRNAGYKQSQILVTQDLITVLQDAYEGSLDLGRPYVCFADDGILSFFDLGIPGLPPMETLGNMYTFDIQRIGQIDGEMSYGKWLKDW